VLEISALRTFRPLIATPSHNSAVFINYMLSAIQFQEACFAAGLRLDFFFRHGDSLVTRARNDCVAYFLTNPQFTHLFWVDADIGYSPEAALRLLRADRDIVAGVYPLKREDWPADGCRKARHARGSKNCIPVTPSTPGGSAKTWRWSSTPTAS
jgi:hypothetical protein